MSQSAEKVLIKADDEGGNIIMHSGDSSVYAETDVAGGRYRTFMFRDANTDSPKYSGSFYKDPTGIDVNLDDITTLKNVRYYPTSYFNFDSSFVDTYGDPWCYVQRDGTNIYLRCRIVFKNITTNGWYTLITLPNLPFNLPDIWFLGKSFLSTGLVTFDCHCYNKQIDTYLGPGYNGGMALIEISGCIAFG